MTRRDVTGLVRILLLFESALYSAVTPVLPYYARTLGASKPAVGVLAAAYSAGMIPGSVLGGWAANRIGVRRTTLLGLSVFAIAAAAFGFATDLVTLDGLRFVQGVACGGIWGGALTWVIATTSIEHRGTVLGSVIGAATFGTLLGPLLGTAAVATSPRIVFPMVGAVSVGLALWVRLHPEPVRAAAPSPTAPRRQVRRRQARGALVLGTWLVALEALTIGATNALLPLRLSRLGATGVTIGATFLAASALATVMSAVIGRLTDRRGSRLPLTVGLVGSAILLPALALPHSSVLLAGLIVLALGGPSTTYMIPATTLMTASAERAGVALVLVTTLLNLAYASGETIGAPVAAIVSQLTSDAVPLIGLGVLMLLTLFPARALQRRSEPAEPPSLTPGPGGADTRAAAHGKRPLALRS